ncbi:MAG: NUDIX hydrolase [Alkalispirochaeta sp.]
MDDDRQEYHLLWNELDRNTLVDTPVFTLVRSRRRAADGREADYYVMDAPDWANVVALTEDSWGRQCFIMVRQFRHGSMAVSLEFPGGVVDPGEDPAAAIVRELKEETGYVSEHVHYLGSVNPNPALMGNRCHTYLAEDCSHPGDGQDLDENEIIDVELVPVEEIVGGTRNGEFDHAMMHVALEYYLRHRTSASHTSRP